MVADVVIFLQIFSSKMSLLLPQAFRRETEVSMLLNSKRSRRRQCLANVVVVVVVVANDNDDHNENGKETARSRMIT